MLAGDVVISEFLTANQNNIRDAFGSASDWIELHNQGGEPVDLTGWFLTDEANNLAKWRFPSRTLAPGEYLVVFASGAGAQVGSELHTSFRLSTSGEYLALVEPDGLTVASEFQPTYAPQVIDVSFGRDTGGSLLYYTTPTPGSTNGAGQAQIPLGVYISEFMAVNHSTLADADGDYADWIELHNAGTTAVNLLNWTLTDDEGWLNRWEFPSVTIAPGEFRVVFASGNDRRDPGDELHTNFKLSSFGEYLALVDPSGTVVSDYQEYPTQMTDVSYGLSPDLREVRFFSTPTPGAVNAQERLRVSFDHARGFYDQTFQLTLSSDTSGATIRYTLDGSEPAANHGDVYTSPITISGTTMLRAAAFLAAERGPVFTQSYLFESDVLAQTGGGLPNTWGFVSDYDVDTEITTNPAYRDSIHTALRAIPSVSLVVDPTKLFGITDGIYANPMMDGSHFEPAASLEWLDQAGGTFGNSQHDATLRIEHSTGSVMPPDTPKLSFRVQFDIGNPAATAELPIGGESLRRLDAVVLDAGYEDSWLHPDGFQRLGALYGRDEWLRQTQAAMNQPALAGSFVHLYINGLYWGLYSTIEAPTSAAAARQRGGIAADYDVVGPGGAEAGDSIAWNALLGLLGTDTSERTTYDQVRQYLDVVNLADFAILNRFASQRASDAQGWYAFRRRGANSTFQFWSWDSEETLGATCGIAPAISPSTQGPQYIFSRLTANAEFRQLVADRVNYHLGDGGALASGTTVARLLDLDLAWAILGESARWGDYRRDAHPYSTTTSTGTTTPPAELFTLAHWQAERDRIATNYLPTCGEALVVALRDDGLFPSIDAPTLSQLGGEIDPGFSLTMESAAGTVFYTLDGSDPRLPGGALSPAALRYDAPIPLDRSVRLTARSLGGMVWSAATEATFITRVPPPIVVTEIMYHPGGPSAEESAAGFIEDDAFEFIELKNTGTDVLVLDGVQFVDGILFDFAAGSVHTLAPGEHVLVVSDIAAFTARYGSGYVIAGEYRGRLGNGGDYVRITGALGEPIGNYWYGDQDILTDGDGFSLINVFARPDGYNYVWQRSAYRNGSPGEDDPFLAPGSVVINEVLASGVTDWIELFNTTDENVEVGGWFLSDEPGNVTKSSIPDGSLVPAHGYLVLREGVHFTFGLSRSGEQLSLTSARDGEPGGYRETVTFERAETNVSFGRHTMSDGVVEFVRQSVPTPGVVNAGPRISPVVINEIMYHPAAAGDEFIELYNTAAESIPLDGWRMTAIDYAFEPGTTIAAGAYLVVAPIDPTTFRARYGVPADVPIVGPYVIVLSNSGESVTLFQPDGNGEVRADQVVYDHEAPWSMLADGSGASLVRLTATAYGNDAASWSAGNPGGTPGTANASVGQTPQSIPYTQGFEGDSLAVLPGWCFAVTDGGTWDVNSALEPPHTGQRQLRAVQTGPGDTIQEAVLALDLSGYVGTQDLALDFWTRRDRNSGATGVDNYATLEVRGAGGTWHEVATLRPNLGQYTHYAFDLDAELAEANIAGQSQAYLRLRHFGQAPGDALWLDDVRVSQLDFFGPNVVMQVPAGTVDSPVSVIDFAFDDPINATSFTAGDIRLVGPDGHLIGVQAVAQITSSLWRVTFAPQNLPGVYHATVGPDIIDTAGNAMNQGGATIDGQAIGSEAYRGSFSIAIPSARSFPVVEGFETPTLAGLNGWSFGVTNSGAWEISSQGAPHGSTFQLKSAQTAFGRTVKDAVLRLDLSAQANSDDLVLDFWATRQGHSTGNYGAVYASSDGTSWSQVYSLSPPLAESTYFVFDLDAALDAAGISRDDSVLLKFSHTGRFTNDVMLWDDVRISDVDLFGAQVVGMNAQGVIPAPLSNLTITFDEPIDAASLTAVDVRIVGPTGYDVPITGAALDHGDGRTFSLPLNAPATLSGLYRVFVGPDVLDLAGNALNQDGDPISGETNGHDTFAGSFEIGPATPLELPYSQDFGAGQAEAFSGWSFFTTGSGRWTVDSAAGRDGGYGLEATQTGVGSATQDAMMVFDLASWPTAAPLYLDLWAQRSGTASSSVDETNVLFSGDGDSWKWLLKLAPTDGNYTYYAHDLGQALVAAGIPRDGKLYLRIAHRGGNTADGIRIDNLRVSDINPFGPRVVAQTPLSEVGGISYFDVTFSERVDPASFTTADVSITLPGSTVQVTDVTTSDRLTFRISLTKPQLAGIYTLRIGPDILRDDGVPMNQDRDSINGEHNGDDAYMGSLFVAVHPQSLPYAQSFEDGDFRGLAGWVFKAQGEFDWGGGDWKVVSNHNPYDGRYHVEATQIADCWTQHDAVLALNLAGQAGANDLVLEFNLQRIVRDERNMAKLRISGDGSHWTQVGTPATLIGNATGARFADVDGDGILDMAPSLGVYAQYSFDLDRLLAQAGLSSAETVYVDWHRLGFWKDSITTIDRISIRRLSTPIDTADLDGDGRVGVSDIAKLQRSWGMSAGASRSAGDLNGDGAVTAADLAILVSHFGRTSTAGAPSPAAAIVRANRLVARDRLLANWPANDETAAATNESRVLRARSRRAAVAIDDESSNSDDIDSPTTLRVSRLGRTTQSDLQHAGRRVAD